MPIDARIPLGVNPINIRPRTDTLMDVMRLREAQDTMQDRSLQRQETQRKLKEEADIREAIRAAGGDLKAAQPAIAKINPTYGIAVQNTLDEQTAKQQKARLDQLAYQNTVVDYDARLFGSAHDDTSYQAAVNASHALHDQMKVPRIAYPQAYDAATVQGLREQSLSAKDQLAEARKRLLLGDEDSQYGRARAMYMRDHAIKPEAWTFDQEQSFHSLYTKKAEGPDTGRTEEERDLFRHAKRAHPDITSMDDITEEMEKEYARLHPKTTGTGTGGAPRPLTPAGKNTAIRWRADAVEPEAERVSHSKSVSVVLGAVTIAGALAAHALRRREST